MDYFVSPQASLPIDSDRGLGLQLSLRSELSSLRRLNPGFLLHPFASLQFYRTVSAALRHFDDSKQGNPTTVESRSAFIKIVRILKNSGE